jgi:uncharacterized membrane protein
MDWTVTAAIQWIHVLLGILWFGTTLSLDIIVIPAVNRLPIVAQREISSHIGARATPIFKVVVPLIVVLGVVRGTVMGPIRTIEAVFGTPYGLTWLAALLLTLGVYAWGLRVLIPALHAMDTAPLQPDGSATPELITATNRVKRLVSAELLGFVLIFTCMILMRFGL